MVRELIDVAWMLDIQMSHKITNVIGNVVLIRDADTALVKQAVVIMDLIRFDGQVSSVDHAA